MSKFTVDAVRRRFREAGRHVPSKKTAQAIINALPQGALATGWSQEEVLEVVVANEGAENRLLAMARPTTARQHRPKRRELH